MEMVLVLGQVLKGLPEVGEKSACQVGKSIKDTCAKVVMQERIWVVLSSATGVKWGGLAQQGKERGALVKESGDLKGGGGMREVVTEGRTGRGVKGIGPVRGMGIASSVEREATERRTRNGTGQRDQLLEPPETKRRIGLVPEKKIMGSAGA